MAGCGQVCAIITAFLLVVCGVSIMVIGPMHANLPREAIEGGVNKACYEVSQKKECFAKLVSAELQAQTDFTLPKEVTDAANKAVLELAPDEKKIYSECMWQIKNDALSCECGVRINNDPAAYLKCDCKNFDFPEWKLLAFAILGAGIMCILIAICGCGASFKAAPVALYSVCSGLFTLIFLVIGVMLVGIGMVVSGSLNDAVPKEERACVTAKYLFDKAVVFLYGLGIPLMAAGLLMFVGCYACCCCASHFKKDDFAPPSSQEDFDGVAPRSTAMMPDDVVSPPSHDGFPGAEFYPPPPVAPTENPNKPRLQPRGYPGAPPATVKFGSFTPP